MQRCLLLCSTWTTSLVYSNMSAARAAQDRGRTLEGVDLSLESARLLGALGQVVNGKGQGAGSRVEACTAQPACQLSACVCMAAMSIS